MKTTLYLVKDLIGPYSNILPLAQLWKPTCLKLVDIEEVKVELPDQYKVIETPDCAPLIYHGSDVCHIFVTKKGEIKMFDGKLNKFVRIEVLP